ncbi:MAG: glycosyltransferase [Candidatus Sphingomonas colombiensis]|nr:glycosyltransferase [Sphingomonas sp.]WEK44386.1 MAG: glycosyltransferase [Sphingomonas sp.]
MPRICVLMASYNGANFIADQIATILNQQDVEVELFIRDDVSLDATPDIIAAEARRDARVQVVDPQGISTGSAARNFLRMLETVDFGDANYIALADQDDLWLSYKLRRAIERITIARAGGYSANLTAFDNEGLREPWLLLKQGAPQRFDHFFQGASAGCTYVLSRAAADAIRPWLATLEYPVDYGISHDWLIYAFARNRELGWVYDDAALLLYRQHSANVYGAQTGLQSVAARIKLLRARWYRRHVLWIASQLDLSTEEQVLVRRVARGNLTDRLWLLAHARQLRRRPRDVLMLRLAIATGLF